MFWWGFFVGLLAAPAIIVLYFLTVWALQRNYSWGPCHHCKHYGGEQGVERGLQVHYLFDRTAHRLIWARTRRHRKSRGDRWREHDLKGWQNTIWDDRFML